MNSESPVKITQRRITSHSVVRSDELAFETALFRCSQTVRGVGRSKPMQCSTVKPCKCTADCLLLCLALNHIDFQAYVRMGVRAEALSSSDEMKQYFYFLPIKLKVDCVTPSTPSRADVNIFHCCSHSILHTDHPPLQHLSALMNLMRTFSSLFSCPAFGLTVDLDT